MRSGALVICLVGSLVAVYPSTATAGLLKLSLQYTATDGTVDAVTIQDGDALDINGAGDAITYIGGLNGFVFSVTQGVSRDVPASLSLQSVNVQFLRPGELVLALEDSDYGSAGDYLAVSSIDGLLEASRESSLTAQSWVNRTNVVPSADSNIESSATTLALLSSAPLSGSFSSSDFASFTTNGSYSIFSKVTINFAGAIGAAAFDLQTSVRSLAASTPVPEPGTLVLFGAGLLGLARVARRNRTSVASS